MGNYDEPHLEYSCIAHVISDLAPCYSNPIYRSGSCLNREIEVALTIFFKQKVPISNPNLTSSLYLNFLNLNYIMTMIMLGEPCLSFVVCFLSLYTQFSLSFFPLFPSQQLYLRQNSLTCEVDSKRL